MDARTTDKTRDPGLYGDYWWANRFLSRHRQVEDARGKTIDVVMIGDSITHFWEWLEPVKWAEFTAGRTAINLGYGGDHTEQVVWRIEHGELDGYVAKNVVLMIGTNNNLLKAKANIVKAIGKIVGMIRERQPSAKIILHPIFPRGRKFDWANPHIAEINVMMKRFADEDGRVAWVDFNAKLVDESGFVPESIMEDGLHPTAAGYGIWQSALEPVLVK